MKSRRSPLLIALCAVAVAGCVGLTPARTDAAGPVSLEVGLADPVVVAGAKKTTYLKVGVRGIAQPGDGPRSPVNVSLVIDRSGSMEGAKIDAARAAARVALDHLGPQDILSIVAYDTSVEVLMPATRLTDKEQARKVINGLRAGGNTALFGGVVRGAAELRKFATRNQVNRVILLSDGLANVGPSSPNELAQLGASLSREGISVTTLGLGLDYNEDLMSRMAKAGEGNHAFVERPGDLARIFSLEFGDLLSVVARDVDVSIECAPGVRPVRSLGREADIVGQRVTARLGQITGGGERFVMLEVELPPGELGGSQTVADVMVSYVDLAGARTDQLSGAAKIRYTGLLAEAEASIDRELTIRALELVATERNRQAVALRDAGKLEEARGVLHQNSLWLEQNEKKYKAPSLGKLSKDQKKDSKELDSPNWNRQRKEMRSRQHQYDFQQSY